MRHVMILYLMKKATKMLHEWIFMLWFIPRSIVHSWAAVMFPHKSIFEKMWIHKKYEEKKTNIVIYLYLRQFNLTAAQWLHFLPIFVIQSLYFLDMLETTLFMLPLCYAVEQQYRMFFILLCLMMFWHINVFEIWWEISNFINFPYNWSHANCFLIWGFSHTTIRIAS